MAIEILERLKKELPVIKQAPFSFGSVLVTCALVIVVAVWWLLDFKYGAQLELARASLNEAGGRAERAERANADLERERNSLNSEVVRLKQSIEPLISEVDAEKIVAALKREVPTDALNHYVLIFCREADTISCSVSFQWFRLLRQAGWKVDWVGARRVAPQGTYIVAQTEYVAGAAALQAAFGVVGSFPPFAQTPDIPSQEIRLVFSGNS